MLESAAIGREITFYAEKPIEKFAIVQTMYLFNNPIE